MILYTPMQLELVTQGLESMDNNNLKEIDINGIPSLVQEQSDGSKTLVKLLSTNPHHYLNRDLIPGAPVKF